MVVRAGGLTSHQSMSVVRPQRSDRWSDSFRSQGTSLTMGLPRLVIITSLPDMTCATSADHCLRASVILTLRTCSPLLSGAGGNIPFRRGNDFSDPVMFDGPMP
jgi:hypothetical protein